MSNSGRKLLYSSIWKRFVFQFSVVVIIFLVATLLMVLHVSLPRSTEDEQRLTDRQILRRELQIYDDLDRVLKNPDSDLAEMREIVAESRRGIHDRLERNAELEQLERAKQTPEDAHEVAARIEDLRKELRPLLPVYPAEEVNREVHIRMILILLVIFTCLGGMMYVFVADVVGPLEGIIETSRRVAEGDMAVSFPLRDDLAKRDEIDDLAMILNDLLANLQEAFLLIGALNKETQDAFAPLAELASEPDASPNEGHEAAVENCQACMAEINEILESFDFFTTSSIGEGESRGES